VSLLWDNVAQVLAATVLLLVAELGRRVHNRRRANSERPPASAGEVPSVRAPTRKLVYAQRPEERCRLVPDCVLVRGHGGPCYLTSWLFDVAQRRRLRRLRGVPEGE